MIEQIYFEEYANYSVKVDRYFHCVNAYANSHNGLKYIHDNLDRIYKKVIELKENGTEIDEEIRLFFNLSKKLEDVDFAMGELIKTYKSLTGKY